MEKNNLKNYSQILTIVLIIVIIAIIGVLTFVGYNAFKDKKTKETYTEAANNFEIRGSISNDSNITTNSLETINVSSGDDKQMLEGYEIIGTITIPKVDLKCPILPEVDKRVLEIAVGQMYTTGGLNQPGNTVLYGHNYRNSLFFSRNDELVNGDKIYIVDKTKRKVEYEIYNIFVTAGNDSTFYARNSKMTGGKCEVTLSTCTDDVNTTDNRLIIQAREV